MAERVEVSGPPHLLGMLKSANPGVSGMYLFDICRPRWPDTEGAAVAWDRDTAQTLLVAWMGAEKPPADRPVILHPVGEYYVAGLTRKAVEVPTGAVITGCQCTSIPVTLYMIPNNAIYNGGMFKPCTIVYGDTPPEYATLALGTKSFLSVESFIDQIGDTYRYFFTCVNDRFTLTRVYAGGGSPFRDTTRFTWVITATGNACNPFLLTNGTVYQGGDTRSQITITPTNPGA